MEASTRKQMKSGDLGICPVGLHRVDVKNRINPVNGEIVF